MEEPDIAVANGVEAKKKRNRFLPFDGIRAIAVILVFCTHTGASIFRGGWIGVDLFFALSGYLITDLLLAERAKNGTVSYSRFYSRRFLRLMPALIVMVVLVTPFNLWLGGGTLMDSVASLLYFQDFWAAYHFPPNLLTQTWSLAVEEQFYLVWPVCLVFCARYRWARIPFVVGVVLATAAALKLGLSHVGTTGVYFLPQTSLPVIGAGAAIAVYLHLRDPSERVKRWWASPVVAGTAVAGLLVILVTANPYDNWLFEGGIVLLALVPVALICHTLAAPTGPFARLLSARPLIWLGQRSYGFYLWHFPIAQLMFMHHFSPWVIAAVALPSSLVLTELSWRFVEQPFLRVKDRRFSSTRSDGGES
jgi:peptidoglycan/LPS O-acetylase OafA/YrhL